MPEELVDRIAKIIQPEVFFEYRHAGPIDETERLVKAQAALLETTRVKAREIIALIRE